LGGDLRLGERGMEGLGKLSSIDVLEVFIVEVKEGEVEYPQFIRI
jgi:hypothetical protein